MNDHKETESDAPDYSNIPDEIREKLEMLELMVKESTDVIWVMDSNLKTTYMSPSVEKQLGYSVEEYSNLPLSERLPTESFELSQQIFRNEILPVMKGERKYDGKPIIFEMLHRRKNGEDVWGEISFSFLRDENDKITRILGITRNIEARKRAQEELAASREEYRKLVENTNDWIWKIDHNNKFIYSNQASEKILGFPISRILGSTPFDFADPETKKTSKTRFDQIKKSALPIEGLKMILNDKNKRKVYLDVNGSPTFDAKGHLSGYQGIARDISEYQALLNKLSRLEPFQSTMLSLPDIGIIELDDNFEILQWNPGAASVFGFSKSDAVKGEIFKSLWEPVSWLSFKTELKKKSNPVPQPFVIKEKRNKRQDSKFVQCLWYINPIVEDQKLKSIWIYVKDISGSVECLDLLSNYQLFFDSFCDAVIFTDSRLRISAFSPVTVGYFKPRASVKKGMHIAKLFTDGPAGSSLEKIADHATRTGAWQGEVRLISDAEKNISGLKIISLNRDNGKTRGLVFLINPLN